MIHGYPRWPGVAPGSTLTLHVSTDAPVFRVDFYRQGERLAYVASSPWQRGRAAGPSLPDRDWGWPRYEFPVPASWPSGAYIALLVEGSDANALPPPPDTVEPDGRDGRALFVVRASTVKPRARILYKLSLATYHAYNASGGGSVYVNPVYVPNTSLTKVSLRRPGGGTGGALSFPEAIDVYDPASPREGFAHWDVPFIRWLARDGWEVDFCTDLDLHQDPGLLRPYSLLLSVGHDEYWSEAMRTHVEHFVSAGGNVAFFSANTCWWRIHFVDDDTAFVCHHPPFSTPDSDQWWRIRPENSLTGVSYRNGGGWWNGSREAVGYTVHHASHWIFDGTGVRDGDQFGARQRLVGYECDGARFDPTRRPLQPAGDDGTPPDFVILGVGRLGPGWQDRPRQANAAATMGIHGHPGRVFTCGTTDWARVLHSGEPVVETVTRNVLARLSAPSVRVVGPIPARFGAPVAIANEPARFHADPGDTVTDGDLTYHWTMSSGDPGPDGHSTFEGMMPADATLVTVTVTIRRGDCRVGFGSATVRVLSRREALQAEILERLRLMAEATAPSPNSTLEPRDGNRPFGDPRWDPVRDGLRASLPNDTLASLGRAAVELRETVERLMAVQSTEPPDDPPRESARA